MVRILKDCFSVSLKPENLDGKIDFVRIFGRSATSISKSPLLATGRGAFLLNQAMAWLKVNFLGFERAGKYHRYATDCPEYFELITELMEANKNHLEPTEFISIAGAKDAKWVGTNFE